MDPSLTELLTQLGLLTAKNASASVATRIRASKAAGKHDETVNELQDIIQELLDERSELQRIASALKEYALAEAITGADIKYITDKLIPTVEKLVGIGRPTDEQAESLAMIKELVSPEMLTILQLVGFSYKRAIGEPLTRLVESLITKGLPSEQLVCVQTAALERETQLAKVALSSEATANFLKLTKIG